MNKRISSRAVIIENNKLLTFFRRKVIGENVITYYSLPGGGLDDGETIENCVIREIKEELEVDIEIIRLLDIVEDLDSIQYVFHVKIIDGIPKLSGEELLRNSQNNYYEVKWLELSNIDSYNLRFKDLIKKLKI